MKTITFVTLVLLLSFQNNPAQAQVADSSRECAPWLQHHVQQLHTDIMLDLCAESAGKTLLLVNTASYCGYTYQFTQLEALYQRYRDEGLLIIGFPSNSFNQEDSDSANTAEVCYVNHGVTFLMTEALPVTGSGAHPVFQHLAAESSAPGWNFNKYLVGRDGHVHAHFPSQVEADDARLLQAIEALL